MLYWEPALFDRYWKQKYEMLHYHRLQMQKHCWLTTCRYGKSFSYYFYLSKSRVGESIYRWTNPGDYYTVVFPSIRSACLDLFDPAQAPITNRRLPFPNRNHPHKHIDRCLR